MGKSHNESIRVDSLFKKSSMEPSDFLGSSFKMSLSNSKCCKRRFSNWSVCFVKKSLFTVMNYSSAYIFEPRKVFVTYSTTIFTFFKRRWHIVMRFQEYGNSLSFSL